MMTLKQILDQKSAFEKRSFREDATPNEMAAADAIREVAYTANQLTHRMRGLAERMTDCATWVDDGGYSINSLGEVQGRGSEIDMLCVKLNAQMSIAALLMDLAGSAG